MDALEICPNELGNPGYYRWIGPVATVCVGRGQARLYLVFLDRPLSLKEPAGGKAEDVIYVVEDDPLRRTTLWHADNGWIETVPYRESIDQLLFAHHH